MDLHHQLSRQLDFLERSCTLFDGGYPDEAIRIATTLRVIFHQTHKSESLLNLLGIRDEIRILSTVRQVDDEVTALFDGVAILSSSGIRANISTYSGALIGVDSWWNQVVAITSPGIRHTRRSIVLSAANKDGGAHVASALPNDYSALVEGLWHNEDSNCQLLGITNHHFYALRTFASETLNSHDLQKAVSSPNVKD